MNHWQRRAAIAKLETEGVTVEHPHYPGWAFSIRRLCQWNVDYQKAVAEIAQRREVIALAEKPRDQWTDAEREFDRTMTRAAFVAGCVAGWKGVTDDKAKPMPFTQAGGERLLGAFPDLEAFLSAVASDPSRFVPPSDKVKAELVEGN